MEQRISNRMPILDHELKWREREMKDDQRKGGGFDSLLCVCQREIVVCDTGEDLIQDLEENGAKGKGERERGDGVWRCVEEGSKERP